MFSQCRLCLEGERSSLKHLNTRSSIALDQRLSLEEPCISKYSSRRTFGKLSAFQFEFHSRFQSKPQIYFTLSPAISWYLKSREKIRELLPELGWKSEPNIRKLAVYKIKEFWETLLWCFVMGTGKDSDGFWQQTWSWQQIRKQIITKNDCRCNPNELVVLYFDSWE
jgi:hypothetical protein